MKIVGQGDATQPPALLHMHMSVSHTTPISTMFYSMV